MAGVAEVSTLELVDELVRRAHARFDLSDRVTIELRGDRGECHEMFCHERIPRAELNQLDPPSVVVAG